MVLVIMKMSTKRLLALYSRIAMADVHARKWHLCLISRKYVNLLLLGSNDCFPLFTDCIPECFQPREWIIFITIIIENVLGLLKWRDLYTTQNWFFYVDLKGRPVFAGVLYVCNSQEPERVRRDPITKSHLETQSRTWPNKASIVSRFSTRWFSLALFALDSLVISPSLEGVLDIGTNESEGWQSDEKGKEREEKIRR